MCVLYCIKSVSISILIFGCESGEKCQCMSLCGYGVCLLSGIFDYLLMFVLLCCSESRTLDVTDTGRD